MPSLFAVAFGDLDHELKSTRRILERLPDEHLGWRPHERSMTLGGLATHITNLPFYGTTIITEEGFDVASRPPSQVLESREAILEAFDRSAVALREAAAGATDEGMQGSWTLRAGEREMFSRPRLGVLRGFALSHLIHHRGQLTVYLRLLDVPVPGLYGQSADDKLEAQAAAQARQG
jgi:uncharacterized damage-inducible protein DinB